MYPWDRRNQQILEVIKMCRDSSKPLLILGSAIYSAIYLSSVGFRLIDFFDVGRESLTQVMGMDVAAFHARFCQNRQDHLHRTNRLRLVNERPSKVDPANILNRALVDPASGDLFFYNFFRSKWQGVYNAGFHDLRRHCKLKSVETDFKKNFRMHSKSADTRSHECLWDRMSLRKCARDHYIRKGIPDGGPVDNARLFVGR